MGYVAVFAGSMLVAFAVFGVGVGFLLSYCQSFEEAEPFDRAGRTEPTKRSTLRASDPARLFAGQELPRRAVR